MNRQLAVLFQQMSDVLQLLGEDGFRAAAFSRASRALEDASQDVAAIGPNLKALMEIDGVGKGIAQRIAEYLTTGKIQEHQEFLSKIPPTLPELLNISGLGPKTIALLWKQAGINGLEDLKQKLEKDAKSLAALPGLGKKKVESLRKSLTFAASAGERILLGQAMPLAQWLLEKLRELPQVKRAEYAGSLRRGRETIGDIDLLAAADEGDTSVIADRFVTLEPVTEVLGKGATKTSVRIVLGNRSVQVDLRIVRPESFGAAMVYFTGSKEHNVLLRQRAIDRGYKLSEYGLFKGESQTSTAGRTEEEVYEKLGLAWIDPELREARDEIELAARKKLPKLLRLADIKAELHGHTTDSDGHWSIHEYALACAERGFHTIAITDHSQSQVIAHGLTPQRLEKQIEQVRTAAAKLKDKIAVLAGSEVDILADGSLDLPDSLLKELDVVVASPHSALGQDPEKATRRLLKAIEHPYITILGHPTGRLIGRRQGLEPNMDKLIAAAAQRGIAMEINANSYRLDLRDSHARAAIGAGVKLAIDTDTHGPDDLDQLVYGVLTARRAGVTTKDVVNCLSRSQLHAWLKSTRK